MSRINNTADNTKTGQRLKAEGRHVSGVLTRAAFYHFTETNG
jgi:hypothetical protein